MKTEDNNYLRGGDSVTRILLFAGVTCISNYLHKGLDLIS